MRKYIFCLQMINFNKAYLKLINKIKSGAYDTNGLIHNQDPKITFHNNHMDVERLQPHNTLDTIQGSEYFNSYSL